MSVPALSLLRLKSVSKHWLSLISDPDFRRRHSLRNPNPKVSAFFFSSKTNHHSFNSIPLQAPPFNPFKTLKDLSFTILQSCNGLFLLAWSWNVLFLVGDESHRRPRRLVHVFNPTTNELPSLEKLSWNCYKFVRYGLVFDPRMSPNYNVVCISHVSHSVSHGECHRIEIYSSETGAWGRSFEAPFFLRPSDVSWEMPLHFDDRSREGAVYCDGAVHWMRKAAGLKICDEDETEEYERADSDVMHYFNIGEGSLRIVKAAPPMPRIAKELNKESNEMNILVLPDEIRRYFGESGGRLCLIEIFKHFPTQVEVMEMERDYLGWCVKYVVDLGPVVAPLPEQDASAFVVLFMQKDAYDEDSTADLWLHMPGKAVSYDLSTMSVRTSVVLDSEELFLDLDDDNEYESGSFPYIETLACV